MQAWFKRTSGVPGDRRGKWLVLAAWLIVAMALGPLAGKLADVQDSSANAFLPRSSESAKLNKELEKFRADELMPAVVVYSADGSLPAEGRAKAEKDIAAFQELAAEGEKVDAPLESEDGRALMVVVPLISDADIVATTKKVRDVADANAPPGVAIEVGGPAGSTTDAAGAFESLDSMLMMVTGLVVAILLLITYRSPILWLLPLLSVGFASVLTQVGTYMLAKYAGLPVDPQSSGVLMVLVFGVGTDYALLLIARYREELRREQDRHVAMKTALRRSGPAILASAGTIAIGLVCLVLADVNSSRSMGLVGAIGVVCAFLAMVTILPALLVILGRWVFWPFVPRWTAESAAAAEAPASHSRWERIGSVTAARPRRAWVLSLAATGLLALSSLGLDMGLTQSELLQTKPESVVAQERISAHYPSGSSDPATVVAPSADVAEVRRAAEGTEGVVSVEDGPTTPDGELTLLSVVLKDVPDSSGAKDTIDALRDNTDALVGGTTAQSLDTQRASVRDLWVTVPAVLLVVLLVLIWLLRSVTGPLIMLGTVVVSFFAALGASNLLFEYVMGHAGVDWSVPLLGFVYLVALGIDYNIFLMHRVKEEVALHGHAKGVLTGLTTTGGVITSAGVVLAATFAVIATLPLVPMAQMGVVVGLGILLDTFLVRTILLPALALDLGPRFWWPGALSKTSGGPAPVREDRTSQPVG
ncbi:MULTISPECIES: MMPL family transporter [Streptomyces]|uniref:MMPL family transporter n=1 Tax=Streptomyces TaxID=1883 RepID=UPI001FAD7C1B|nr:MULTISPECIES: MMPL family transporter [Streptomyces]MDX2918358.1 MMPL family transporter [Streptomyces sp. NE06-03C]MDX3606766.1 MMPL family transporter [Streptomyces sp. FL06-04B]MDX3739547.1 MMPL family transporter [Streptomyces sp. ID01-15D]